MRHAATYKNFNLIFSKEPEDITGPDAQLGQPLDTLSETRCQRLVKEAGVRKIKFHGVRHSCATLMLQAGVPVHVVAQRLGHADASMTLNVYAHVMPSMQEDAASKLASVLHG